MGNINLNEKKVVAANPEAALLDLGNGIVCLDFRSKGNSISPAVREFITEIVGNGLKGFDGLVIGNQSKNFSVGADLFAMKKSIDNKDFAAFDKKVEAFQTMTSVLKYSAKPIVAAPYKMVLGGGLEVCMHSHARVALAKSFMGLVELGVGLIPGGGGTKESALLIAKAPEEQRDSVMMATFEKLLYKKVSKDAANAKELNYLQHDDVIIENVEELLEAAKITCLELVKKGHRKIAEESAVLPGKAGYDKMISHAADLLAKGLISPYDVEIGKKIANVLAGSTTENNVTINETQLLKIERNGFVALTQTKGTYERISHFVATGELLKN